MEGGEFYLELCVLSIYLSQKVLTYEQNLRGKMRILMLEDDKAIRDSICEYLCDQKHGVICDSAKDCKIALDHLKANHYDFILVDLMIEGVACIEFINCVREIQPKAKLIIMSAWNGADKIAVENKVDNFLTKPFDLDMIDKLFFNKL